MAIESSQANESKLCQSLMEIHDELRAGTIDIKTAAELSNSAGKIIKAKLGKLDYELQKVKLKGKLPKIPFWEGNVK